MSQIYVAQVSNTEENGYQESVFSVGVVDSANGIIIFERQVSGFGDRIPENLINESAKFTNTQFFGFAESENKAWRLVTKARSKYQNNLLIRLKHIQRSLTQIAESEQNYQNYLDRR